ncbi:hypothetical protein TUM17580_47970 [Citrobacter farmeri]|nr:hypothetical protein TUM17580_47970 [Citrobacter farmeri]
MDSDWLVISGLHAHIKGGVLLYFYIKIFTDGEVWIRLTVLPIFIGKYLYRG